MTDISMTKSELIERIVAAQARSSNAQLNSKDVEFAVKTMLEQMSQALASGDRIEIRGFGSFSLHYRAPRIGRNPKTGESVGLAGKHVPHFKPGKELRGRVNASLQADSGERSVGPTAPAETSQDQP
jgi:integration host factor subunit beta